MLRKDFFKLSNGQAVMDIIILRHDNGIIADQKIGIRGDTDIACMARFGIVRLFNLIVTALSIKGPITSAQLTFIVEQKRRHDITRPRVVAGHSDDLDIGG